MKVLLYLNGPEGCQTGIEDGFLYLKTIRLIEDIEWFYMDHFAKKHGVDAAISHAQNIADYFKPTVIVIFHVGNLKLDKIFYRNLRSISSAPTIVYDEGDMYGGWAKPITKSLKIAIAQSDMVSIRGLGKFHKSISNYNKKIFYTPHHADIARFDTEPFILSERSNKLVLIGNRVKPRFFSSIRRLPGAKEREAFIKTMGEAFSNEFVLYGNGWDGFIGNRGPVDFYKQLDVYRDSWITVAYEHYPEIPYYFSNRLPIALLAGSLYVCHYHEGYENLFKNCDFIFFYKNNNEAIDIVTYLHSLSNEDLLDRSMRAREFALRTLTPNVVWFNFINNVTKVISSFHD